MKVRQLIAKLQKLQQKHGNLDVSIATVRPNWSERLLSTGKAKLPAMAKVENWGVSVCANGPNDDAKVKSICIVAEKTPSKTTKK